MSAVPWIALGVSVVSAIFTGLTYLMRVRSFRFERRKEERSLKADLVAVRFEAHPGASHEPADQILLELLNNGAHRAVKVAVAYLGDSPIFGRVARQGRDAIDSGERSTFVFSLPPGSVVAKKEGGYSYSLRHRFTAHFIDGSGERIQEIRSGDLPSAEGEGAGR